MHDSVTHTLSLECDIITHSHSFSLTHDSVTHDHSLTLACDSITTVLSSVGLPQGLSHNISLTQGQFTQEQQQQQQQQQQ
jgi:hypothetical protein